MRAVLLQRAAYCGLGVTLGFVREALPYRFRKGITSLSSGHTAKELIHRFMIECGAAVVEARKQQVFLAIIGIYRQPSKGEEPILAAQTLDHMHTRRVV